MKNKIIVNGEEYKLMKIGIPVSNEDIRFESSWYTKDVTKQESKEIGVIILAVDDPKQLKKLRKAYNSYLKINGGVDFL